MKSKSTISVIAVLVLVAAIIMLITRFDFNHMDGDDWTILLIIAGIVGHKLRPLDELLQ